MDHTWRRYMGTAGKAALAALGVYASGRLAIAVGRWGISRLTLSTIGRLLKDQYDENIWELVHASTRLTPQTIVEIGLRAEHGIVITRPLGSRRRYCEFDKLFFDFAGISRSPRPADLPVDTSVVIGPLAKRPLKLEIPVMVAGMAYGLALSGPAKVALARGARLAGTATSSGEGIPAPGELEEAGKYVLQVSRSCWNRDPALIERADMIEIQLGQGATGSTGHPVGFKDLDPKSRAAYGVRKKEEVRLYTLLPEMRKPADLPKVVKHFRNLTDVPIGVKIGAGKFLEEDLQMVIDAGVDAVWLDGGQAGSHAAAPTLEDAHGLPTFYALCRAAEFFRRNKLKGRVSLIISGGLYTPGDFLKCLALGADAVGIGTAALLAIAHHDVAKLLPWEPPTQLVYATGNCTRKFNVKEGATGLYHFLMSSTDEMVLSARALGREALSSIDRSDMFSIDPLIAEAAGVDMAHVPQPLGRGAALQPEWLRREHELAHRAEIDRAISHGSLCTLPGDPHR